MVKYYSIKLMSNNEAGIINQLLNTVYLTNRR